ncbi:MFS transporter [Streptomyces sp. NPDC059918]|uniref:MFS transporter n=1 Tax=unclassified Streptomyces TaxID=2593676 RepID=UPI003669A632
MLPQRYRHVLALPGVRTAFLLIFLARLPLTAVSVSVTLHVMEERSLGYGAAGVLVAAWLLGAALGAARVGRAMDRFGVRRVIAVCGLCSAAYWTTAGHLPYPVAVVLGLLAGMVAVPFGPLGRQFMAALVPEDRRRSAFCLDMISAEVAFVLGPALAIALATRFTPTAALTCIGTAIAVASAALVLRRPPRAVPPQPGPRPPTPMTADIAPQPGAALPRPRLPAGLRPTLLMAGGTVFAVMGMEVALYASLRAVGQVHWSGMVLGVVSGASIVGGIAYGCLRRTAPHAALAAAMCALLIPVGLLGHSWWLLAAALVPANVLCAPALVAATEAITAATPAARRGEALGRYESATRLALAASGPLVGAVIDRSSPAWGFVAAGAGGLLLVLLAQAGGATTVRPSLRPARLTDPPSGAGHHPQGNGAWREPLRPRARRA